KESAEILVAGLPLPGYGGLRFGLPAGQALWRKWSADRPDVIYVATEGPLGGSRGVSKFPLSAAFTRALIATRATIAWAGCSRWSRAISTAFTTAPRERWSRARICAIDCAPGE